MQIAKMRSEALAALKSQLPEVYMRYYVEETNDWLLRTGGESTFDPGF